MKPEMVGNDYYAILGVGQKASPRHIKQAYRQLALNLHPDRVGDENVARFLLVREAYDTLKNDELRSRYDRWLVSRRRKGMIGHRASAWGFRFFLSFMGAWRTMRSS